jgi:hypothetical protein
MLTRFSAVGARVGSLDSGGGAAEVVQLLAELRLTRRAGQAAWGLVPFRIVTLPLSSLMLLR